MGAVVGFILAVSSQNLGLGLLASMMAGMPMSLLFSFLAISLVSIQMTTGLALTIFGTGLSAFICADYAGIGLGCISASAIHLLSDIPVIGKALFSRTPLFIFHGIVFCCLVLF